MKKIILFITTAMISVFITFLVFGTMSWYHFGDTPTKTVLVRMFAFGGVLFAVLSIIGYYIIKKRIKEKDTNADHRLTKKAIIISLSILTIVILILFSFYSVFVGGIYAASDKVVQKYTGTASIAELEQYEQWEIGENKYGQPIFVDAKKAFDFLEDEFDYVIDMAYDMYHENYNLGKFNRQNYSVYKNLIYQIPTESENLHHRCVMVAKFLDIYENSFKRWVYIPGFGWDRICP